MNRKNIESAIRMLQRAKNLDMRYWQERKNGCLVDTIRDLHTCGNTACFAGYLACSPGFKKAGGVISSHGLPTIIINEATFYGHEAVAYYLDIPFDMAHLLVHGGKLLGDYSSYYDKPWSKVTPADVIAKLRGILAMNPEPVFKGD